MTNKKRNTRIVVTDWETLLRMVKDWRTNCDMTQSFIVNIKDAPANWDDILHAIDHSPFLDDIYRNFPGLPLNDERIRNIGPTFITNKHYCRDDNRHEWENCFYELMKDKYVDARRISMYYKEDTKVTKRIWNYWLSQPSFLSHMDVFCLYDILTFTEDQHMATVYYLLKKQRPHFTRDIRPSFNADLCLQHCKDDQISMIHYFMLIETSMNAECTQMSIQEWCHMINNSYGIEEIHLL